MFFHRLTLRRWAARMLLVWLFGVGVGIANACVAAEPVHPGESHGLLQVSAQADTQDEPDCHTRTACAALCDQASVAMAQLKSKADSAHDHAMPAAVSTVVLAVQPYAPLPLRATRRDGVRTASIPITLLRLAL